ncbi:MAG: hypothetical protein JWQ70_2018 [Aeromicrobium sp.]|nr:hypothetical protein [Aeromicrobium sp.]
MRAFRVLLALFLAVLLCSPSVAAFADDGTDGGSGDTTSQPTEPTPSDTETTPTPDPTDTTPAPDPTDTPTTPEPSDDPTTSEPSDDPTTTDPTDPTDTPDPTSTPPTDVISKGFAKIAAALATPVAVDDGYTVATNGTLNKFAPSGVFKNDAPGLPFPSQFTVVTGPTHGTLSQPFLQRGGGFHYVPTSGYAGPDTFTYTYTVAGSGTSNTATVSIDVNATGTPVAKDDAYTTSPGVTLVRGPSGVFGNDSGVQVLGFQVPSGPSHGTLSQPGIASDGGFTYVPDPGFTGIDTFTYRFFDDTAIQFSNTATVTITVGDPPTTQDDEYNVNQGALLTVPSPGIFANDSSQTDDGAIVDPVQDGMFNGTGAGGFTYKPNPLFTGDDSYTYTITDPVTHLVSNVGTVVIHVLPVDPPVAVDDSYGVTKDTLLTVLSTPATPGVFVNDLPFPHNGDGGHLVTGPTHGTFTGTGTGGFTYQPDAGYTGPDSFVYNFTDPDTGLTSNDATVTLTVRGAPVANDDNYTVAAGSVLTVDPPAELANDSSANPGLVVALTLPSNGDYVQTGVGVNTAFTYTPDPGFVGQDSFTYQYTDNDSGLSSNTATVTIDVTPVAVDDDFDVPCDPTLPIYFVLDNDPDAGLFTIADVQSDVSNGFLLEVFFGVFLYIPNDGFSGDDSFTYTYDENGETSNVATVTFHVADCSSDDPGDGHHGHHHHGDGGDSDGVLPDTGSGISPWTLSFAGMSLLAGFVIVRRNTKRA